MADPKLTMEIHVVMNMKTYFKQINQNENSFLLQEIIFCHVAAHNGTPG